MVVVNGGAVAWTSRKQPCVALSTIEAESVAAKVAFCKIIGLKWDLEVMDPQLGDSQ